MQPDPSTAQRSCKNDRHVLPRTVERALKRALLRSPGVTQRDAAAALGCSEGHLAHCLNGSDTRRLHASDLPDVLAALPRDEAVALVDVVFLQPLGHRSVPIDAPAAARDVELGSLDVAAALGRYLGHLRECLEDGRLDYAERQALRIEANAVEKLAASVGAALAPNLREVR